MNKVNTIPEQYYLSTVFLGTLIVFRSTSLQTAARTVISLAALMILWQILLFMRVFISTIPLIVVASLTAVAIGTITSELLYLLPALGITTAEATLPEQLYLLFCVPVLIFQAEHRIAEVRKRSLKEFFVFGGAIFLLAAVRELFGFGMVFGMRILPGIYPGMTFFRHSSSAAFLLAGLMILLQWIYRRTGKGDLLFAKQAVENQTGNIPYLQTALEKSYLRVSFLFLGITLISGVYPVAVFILFGGGGKMLLYLLPVTTLVQGIMIGLVYLFMRSLRGSFSGICLQTIVIPTQTMILLLPFYFSEINFFSPERTFLPSIFYFAYLIVGWFFVCSTMLFLRAVRRKLIFGRRPVFVDGLPLTFIVLGICLIILSGFMYTVRNGMLEMLIT